MTATKKCGCIHEFQDRTYGKGMRVMNMTAKGTKDSPKYRCTICLTIH